MARTPDYFKDKAVIITGAGSGIGRAAALIFAREGAKVLCADVDEATARGTADAITAAGGKALSIKTDVTQRAQVQEMADNGMEAFGRIHFLFNSAGSAMRRAKFLDIDDDLFDRTFDLNVKGTFYGMQAILPHMLEHGGGVIVNVSSMAHKRGGPGTSVHYAASKGAVNTMTMGVAREFADRGIRCMAVAPAAVNTAFQSSSNTSPEMMQRVLADLPMKRFAEADEVAELVLFLCSDACQFMTADTVYVSGGGGWR
jgi:3-oxoacyl-[acyl-carrier protein] reductase